ESGRHFVVDGAPFVGDLVCRDPRRSLAAYQGKFVAVGYSIDLADIDGQSVHADGPDDRYPLPPYQRVSVVGVHARPAVTVADPQGRDARRSTRPEAQPVPDTLAGRQVEDPQRQGAQRQGRPQVDLPIEGRVRLHSVQHQPATARLIASSGSAPWRPMPVSTLSCTDARRPSLAAARSSMSMASSE